MTRARLTILIAWLMLLVQAGPGPVAAQPATPSASPASAQKVLPDPFKDTYAKYVPDFVQMIERGSGYGGAFNGWKADAEKMKLSSETSFYTLNILGEAPQANALVESALQQEGKGQYRDALKMYLQVIEKWPSVLYRVSPHGVFVPISQYCQRRILGFPPADLAFYRSLYDPKARDVFDQARRKYSLIGLSEIVDTMMATSYGGRALLELGNAALDAGYYLAAMEYYTTVRDFFPDASLKTPELSLKIQHCQKLLGASKSASPGTAVPVATAKSDLPPEQIAQLQAAVDAAKATKPPFFAQVANAAAVASDDYTLMPPTTDPMALKPTVWGHDLPGSRLDFFVYSQPVVTENSVIYRHKNIVYCRSILNGELRWTYDTGGRAVWQNWGERMYPQEDVLVQDGLVFTTISKAGPSLVALDETTGQLKWAYGPMVASNEEESRLRFEAAPAGGPRMIYAGYVQDNIEGDTHMDSEYGVIAFDSTTGRIHWRTALCRLAPGKFSAGFAEQRRNRIRSFISPPLYHEGTVYHTTNAGAMAAIDSQSGRIKWLARYPYYPEVHDATRQFGQGGDVVQYTRIYFTPHNPMFWYNQRPLLVGEKLYVLPVDTRMMFCFDRRDGKVIWSKTKASGGSAYLLGITGDGAMALAYTGRNKLMGATLTTAPDSSARPRDGRDPVDLAGPRHARSLPGDDALRLRVADLALSHRLRLVRNGGTPVHDLRRPGLRNQLQLPGLSHLRVRVQPGLSGPGQSQDHRPAPLLQRRNHRPSRSRHPRIRPAGVGGPGGPARQG